MYLLNCLNALFYHILKAVLVILPKKQYCTLTILEAS